MSERDTNEDFCAADLFPTGEGLLEPPEPVTGSWIQEEQPVFRKPELPRSRVVRRAVGGPDA